MWCMCMCVHILMHAQDRWHTCMYSVCGRLEGDSNEGQVHWRPPTRNELCISIISYKQFSLLTWYNSNTPNIVSLSIMHVDHVEDIMRGTPMLRVGMYIRGKRGGSLYILFWNKKKVLYMYTRYLHHKNTCTLQGLFQNFAQEGANT